MNLVPGVARLGNGVPAVEFAGGVRLPMPACARLSEGQPVLYGMRPEHCSVASGEGLPAEVVVVEPTGADTQLFCRFNGQEVTSLVRDRVDCRAGDRIGLVPDLARAHIFDVATGVRLAA
jgi:multiple sugar transport system ATP-binding protein